MKDNGEALNLIDEAEEDLENQKAALPRSGVAEGLVKFALKDDLKLFFDQNGDPHIVLPEKPMVAFPIKSATFKRWLAGKYWQQKGKGFSGDAFQEAVSILEGKAAHEQKVITVFNRLARVGNELYYDLGDDKKVVKITAAGWEVLTASPVLFRRFRHQRQQVEPSRDGNLADVLQFINLQDERDKLLFLTYLIAVLIPDIPRVVKINIGNQGSAKSTADRILRCLIDPSVAEVMEVPKDKNDILQSANHNYCLFLDNLSTLPDWLSDILSRLATGIGFAKRKLFTDDEDIIFNQKVAVGINGINLVAEKPDLLDRSLILKFELIDETQRIGEEEFWQEFNRLKPKILGGMFDIASKTLAALPTVSFTKRPRMADYAKYATAAAIALGYKSEVFLTAFEENVRRQNKAAIEASPVAQVVIEFMADRQNWEGPSSDLYNHLFDLAEAAKLKIGGSGGFPKDVRWLWKRINEVKTNLLRLGIRADIGETSSYSTITLSRIGENNTTDTTNVTLGSKESGNITEKGGNTKNDAVDVTTPEKVTSEPSGGNTATMATKATILEPSSKQPTVERYGPLFKKEDKNPDENEFIKDLERDKLNAGGQEGKNNEDSDYDLTEEALKILDGKVL